MAGRYYNKDAPKRRKKNYLSGILLAAAVLVGIAAILVSILAITKWMEQPEDPSAPSDPTTPTVTDPTTEPTLPTEATQPPTTAPTEPPIPEAAKMLMKDAAFIAAGYDYQKAIAMLEGSEYYKTVPEMAQLVASFRNLDKELVTYAKPSSVTHIFFHSLIVDTSRAFDGDGDSGGYNMYMNTVDEFKAILEQMYAKGYVLISPYDLAHEVTDENGTHFAYGNIRLPAGKTPFIMSQDDLNYYSYMVGTGDGKNETPIFADKNGDGFAHKIVIGADGYPTCEYMDANGNVTTGDYDLVPVLESFIQAHPDFSYHGARAILGVTGYEGVFGYRTKPGYKTALGADAYEKEVEEAKKVAQCLRDHGWIIASHSYGHPAYGNIEAYRVEADSNRWENTVQPIVGDTDVILFPHGSDIHTWHKYPADNAKFQALYADGYRYFYNVDSSKSWNQLGDNYFRGGRRNLDGFRMYYNPELLADLFDVATVFDKARPTPVPNSGWGM